MVKNLKKVEIRAIGTNDFNLNDDNLNVSGYVNQTGTKSDLLYDWIDDTQFYEVIQPGVFQNAIDEAEFIDFYYEHDPEKYLASTKDGSLSVKEDDVGLKMSANIVNTSWGQDAYAMIKSGAIAGMSFGFIVTGENWDTSYDTPIRTITGMQLFEVSAVRFPAYPASDIQARNKQRSKLNKALESRGMQLNNVQIPKKKEVRDMADSSITSNDMNNLISAINDLQKSVDTQTDCLSNSFTSLFNSLNDDSETNSKKTEPTEKRGEDDKSKEDSDKDDEKAKQEREKQEKESKEKRSNALKQLEALKGMK